MLNRGLALAALAAGCSLTAISTGAHAQQASDPEIQLNAQEYDIPAQPLSSALDHFAEISSVDLLYSSDLVEGKRSSAVRGVFPSDEALGELLAGTGVMAARVSDNVFSLTQEEGATPIDASNNGLSGTVRNASTGAALSGALVEIIGTELAVTTNDRGFFSFPEVAAGANQLRVRYLGRAPQMFPIPRSAADRRNLDLALGDNGEDIVVSGYLNSIQRSLNEQLRASNNSTVVSADMLGGFPAETISEALRRVPGVGFGRDDETGEGSRITVRGFSSEAINVQLNGVELQGTSFERTIDLSGFLTENLSQVTIHKSLLPSHEATGSGGLVEIETKSGLDYGSFALNLNAEGEFSPERAYGEEYQLNGTIAGQLTPDFGVVATLQYRNTDRTNIDSRVTDVIPPVLPDGFTSIFTVPASFEFPFDPELPLRLIIGSNIVQRDREEKTLTGSLGFAWDLGGHTRLRLDLQRNMRDVEGVTTSTSFVGATPTIDMPIPELDGEVRRREYISNFRPSYTIDTLDNKLTTDTVSFRGDTTMGRWDFEYRLGYTKARAEGDNSSLNLQGALNNNIQEIIDPSTIVTAPDTNGTLRVIDGLYTTGANGVPIPSLSALGQAAIIDPDQFNVLIASRNLIDNSTESWNAELQVRYRPAPDFIEYVEVGGLYRPTKRNTLDDATNPRNSTIESYVRRLNQEIAIGEIDGAILGSRDLDIIGLPDFSVASVDPSVLPTVFEFLRADNGTRYSATNRTGLDPILDSSAFQPTETSEEKYAAYFEAQLKFGDFDLTAGVRYEAESRSNITIVSPSIRTGPGFTSEPRETFLDAGLITFEEVSGTTDSWTPSFLLNYRPADNIVARLGYFRSTVNPDLRLLNRTQRFFADLRPGNGRVTVFLPNPDLRATVTDNIDIDLSYYFEDSIGLVRAGFFYKDVKNNFTNVEFLDGSGDGVREAYEEFFAPLRADRPDLFEFPEWTEFVLNQPQNGAGGEIYGFEVELVRELDFLPGFLSDFGVLANATYTTADFPTLVSARDDDGNIIQVALDRPLRDQAEWVYNLSLNYNRGGFDGTVIYTYQSATAQAFDEFNINTIVPSYDTLDARLSYTFDWNGNSFTVYVEGDNLLQDGKDAEVRLLTGSQFGDGNTDFAFPLNFQFNGGRTLTAGIRARF
ncbi:TonB-dependent receptor [Aurantiacibacter odishensis]|uniref:TonB-dependent receptor n=1 Tax=Aurantiacibacter odishensis TaxID=1155476 RepID=UPI000E70E8F5|nr:TonB-dependent receptor [Aurantiacibacter odishensis]